MKGNVIIELTVRVVNRIDFGQRKARRWKADGEVKGAPGSFCDFRGRGTCPMRVGDTLKVVLVPKKRKGSRP